MNYTKQLLTLSVITIVLSTAIKAKDIAPAAEQVVTKSATVLQKIAEYIALKKNVATTFVKKCGTTCQTTATEISDSVKKSLSTKFAALSSSDFVKNKINPASEKITKFCADNSKALKITAGVLAVTAVGYIMYKKFYAQEETQN